MVGSAVQVIASAGIIRGEPEKLAARYWQPSLARDVSNLASQPTVILAVGRARDRLVRQRCRGFVWHSCLMPDERDNVK